MKYKPGIKPVPPCRPGGKDCTLRGSDVCHTAECPHGWAEYVKACEAFREYTAALTRERHITRK